MVTRLYVMRHGPAGFHGEWMASDDLRPLTPKGRAAVEAIAEQLVAAAVTVDRILTSPLTRAMETAEIVADRLGVADLLESDPRLEPGFDSEELATILADFADANALMLVGHEPDLSGVVYALIGGGSIDYKKGAVARVDLVSTERPAGALVWLMTPGALGH